MKPDPVAIDPLISPLIDPLIDQVKGFLDPAEGERLHRLARTASRWGPCLEVGSYCGKSTLFLGAGCRDNGGVLFSVDHHRGSEEQQPGEEYFDPDLFDPRRGRIDTLPFFRKTVEQAGLTDTVVPIVCASSLAARSWATPLSLVFIDGGHSYAAVFTDYSCWSRHIIPGGYLLIHDIFDRPEEGGQAPRQIYKLAVGSGLFRKEAMTGTLGVLRRRTAGEIPRPAG